MNEEEIRALEPKYTGNTRHLTEGEAAGIVNDPANQETDDAGLGEFDDTSTIGRLINRGVVDGNSRLQG